ncbi:MAG: hypothetical protein NTY66_00740 [Candidatus Vogelbacteria bacterium]|nr:hypothetical protein [Candidatus Vogelbacteria bacterium]
MNPYIGITGFRTPAEVSFLAKIFDDNLPRGSNRQFHVGAMISRKTMLGEPSRFTQAFPPKELLPAIFSGDEDWRYHCLHYADYRDDPDLREHLYQAIMGAGPGLHAVQLDMTWPDPGAVASAVHDSRRILEVILQIGPQALEAAGNDLNELTSDYRQVASRVLIDLSIGKGQPLNPAKIIPLLEIVADALPEAGLVVAGGLGPDSVESLLGTILDRFPQVSWDATGQICVGGSGMNPLDLSRAGNYLQRSLALLAR